RYIFFFSSRRRHTRCLSDWSSDVCSSDLPASKIYVRNKMKACSEVGLYSEHFELPADAHESTLLERIRALNRDVRIHGILVQLRSEERRVGKECRSREGPTQ